MIPYAGETARLRPLAPGDRDRLLLWRNDPELRDAMMGYRFPVTEPMETRWLERAMDDPGRNLVAFAIEDLADGDTVGVVQLKAIDWISRTAYLAVFVAPADRRGRGLGSEAVRLLLNYAFSGLALRKILLEVAACNAAAIRLYERLGFEEEGRLKRQFYLSDEYHDVVIMAMFKEALTGMRRDT